jgi:Ca2+-binding RTX toxin-like protein
MAAVTVTSDYMVAVGKQLKYSGDAFDVRGQAPNASTHLDINGTVTASAVGPVNGIVTAASSYGMPVVAVGASGALHVQSGDTAYGLFGGDRLVGFINNGLVEVSGVRAAVGVEMNDPDRVYFENGGTFLVTSQGEATGLNLGYRGYVMNAGLVEVNGGGATTAVWVHMPNFPDGFIGLTFDNSGTIRAHNSTGDAIGVNWEDILTKGTSWINTGTIESDIALRISDNVYSWDNIYSGPLFLSNQGKMIGRVEFDCGSISFSNNGSITGDIVFGTGADIFKGWGTQSGQVSGGEGNDLLWGGPGFDNFIGNQGNDTIMGGAGGDDWLVGGKDNDLINGSAGNSILYGNIGNDTLIGGDGNELIRGGQDNDTLSGGAGKDWLSGDKGDDTISGGAGADVFHSSSGVGMDRVTDFHADEGDRVQLDADTSYTLRQAGADTVIDMGNGDQMVLQNVQFASLNEGWIFTL